MIGALLVGTTETAGAGMADLKQNRIDRYLSEISGSYQISADRISIPGGYMTVGSAVRKPCSQGWLCVWKYDNGFDSKQYYRCGTYALKNWIGYGGLENNQTEGTVSLFQDQNKKTLWKSVAYDFHNDVVYWTPIYYITPC
ncbi:hypothetical protein [Amycolatopsis sp. WQ 127309]|uniref:hypothetical protein n=1 Tax=Amycolatopsis sp. WQ 127309 TaxID=2932773 RepID=UPI001FF5C331|nr:hypothetical protein [Amycolatopsis sp. WQ 127309]UOZ05574.1 hypothetical protein MUY22_43225 [Amycolatopsis sp. WQ 127309]